jgi:hypothetical protein
VSGFIRRQKFEKQADFGPLVTGLARVAQASPYLTIIILTSGDNDIAGTPFAGKINESFASWRKEQEKARMPFVTLLRAQRGQYAGYSVTPAPWQIDVPRWQAEPGIVAAKPAASSPSISKSSPATTNVTALIFTGKKPKAPLASAETNVPGAAVSTNLIIVAAAEPSKTQPSTGGQTGVPSPNASLIDPVHASRVDAANDVSNPSATRAASSLAEPPIASAPAPSSNPTSLAAPLRPEPRLEQIIAPTGFPASRPSDTRVQTASALPRAGLFENRLIWIGGFVCLFASGAFLLLRRGTSPGRESLITKSLEREPK